MTEMMYETTNDQVSLPKVMGPFVKTFGRRKKDQSVFFLFRYQLVSQDIGQEGNRKNSDQG